MERLSQITTENLTEPSVVGRGVIVSQDVPLRSQFISITHKLKCGS